MSKNKIGGSNHPVNPKQNAKAEEALAKEIFNRPGPQASKISK